MHFIRVSCIGIHISVNGEGLNLMRNQKFRSFCENGNSILLVLHTLAVKPTRGYPTVEILNSKAVTYVQSSPIFLPMRGTGGNIRSDSLITSSRYSRFLTSSIVIESFALFSKILSTSSCSFAWTSSWFPIMRKVHDNPADVVSWPEMVAYWWLHFKWVVNDFDAKCVYHTWFSRCSAAHERKRRTSPINPPEFWLSLTVSPSHRRSYDVTKFTSLYELIKWSHKFILSC